MRLKSERPLIWVIMLIAFAAAHGERVRSMVLLGPAGGYASLADREERLRGRLEELKKLGPDGLAEHRSPTVVAKGSPPFALELVKWNHRRIRPQGMRQARIHAPGARYGFV